MYAPGGPAREGPERHRVGRAGAGPALRAGRALPLLLLRRGAGEHDLLGGGVRRREKHRESRLLSLLHRLAVVFRSVMNIEN